MSTNQQWENKVKGLLKAELKRRNVAAQSMEVTVGGRQMYRVLVSGFPTKSEAQSSAADLGKSLGIRDAWVSRAG